MDYRAMGSERFLVAGHAGVLCGMDLFVDNQMQPDTLLFHVVSDPFSPDPLNCFPKLVGVCRIQEDGSLKVRVPRDPHLPTDWYLRRTAP